MESQVFNKQEVREKFNEAILSLDYPCDDDDQFVFLRFLIRKGEEQIKVEIMQNMIFTEEPDLVEGVRVLSLRDIGMLKLMAASNRCSFKDIYDLSYLTEEVPLPELFYLLGEKQKKYNGEAYFTIFDLDDEQSPVEYPKLLLKFETEAQAKPNRPFHSTPQFRIANGMTWLGAKANWRRKVKHLFLELDQK